MSDDTNTTPEVATEHTAEEIAAAKKAADEAAHAESDKTEEAAPADHAA